uniref:Receptor protein serine/threonine kinase n=1 Tax=Opuntia streptacantha TaxID=393608 RepID=A0A7C9B0B6_OPUST
MSGSSIVLLLHLYLCPGKPASTTLWITLGRLPEQVLSLLVSISLCLEQRKSLVDIFIPTTILNSFTKKIPCLLNVSFFQLQNSPSVPSCNVPLVSNCGSIKQFSGSPYISNVTFQHSPTLPDEGIFTLSSLRTFLIN